MVQLQERPPVPATKMLVRIHCTGHYEDGRECKATLALIDSEHWEEIIAASPYVQQKCKCGTLWRLADYR